MCRITKSVIGDRDWLNSYKHQLEADPREKNSLIVHICTYMCCDSSTVTCLLCCDTCTRAGQWYSVYCNKKYLRPICVMFYDKTLKDFVISRVQILKNERYPIRKRRKNPSYTMSRKQYVDRNIVTTIKRNKLFPCKTTQYTETR